MTYTPTDRTKVRRRPERASYDRDLVHRIIDEALIAHVAFVDNGEPRVLPTTIVRQGESVIIHGSTHNHLLRTLAAGAPACISITLIDSIVAGRSGFGCSVDYRSVVIFGQAEVVADEEKEALVNLVIQDFIPGHVVRPSKQSELDATFILRFALNEVSAKVRDCGVKDVAADYDTDYWAGRFPVQMAIGPVERDPLLRSDIPTPDYAKTLKRPRSDA